MMKKSNSMVFIYTIKSFDIKYSKSCDNITNLQKTNSYNDFAAIKMPDLLENRKTLSYGEFLRSNPKATKKQRCKAIKDFYENLLS